MADHTHNLTTMNVSTGFLPVFSEDFKDSFGPDSEFVRATSDLFTERTAKMLDKADKLADPSAVAVFSSKPAVNSLKILLEHVDGLMILFQEAMGSATRGTFKSVVDSSCGTGVFDWWLAQFESGHFERCEKTYLPE